MDSVIDYYLAEEEARSELGIQLSTGPNLPRRGKVGIAEGKILGVSPSEFFYSNQPLRE
jgi:hypothetical protein